MTVFFVASSSSMARSRCAYSSGSVTPRT